MISKELLSEVLHQDITAFSIKGNTLFYQCTDYFDDCINIYELVHRCKEWAISKGWILHEVRNLKEYIVYFSGDFRNPSDDFRCDTEPEAVFKACEYILKEHPCNQLT